MRLFIGILLLSFSCLLDFSWFGIGTTIRFFSGIIGAVLMVGNLNFRNRGSFLMISGFILYSYVIKYGPLPLYDTIYIDGFLKYSLRIISCVLFLVGYTGLCNSTQKES